MFACLQDSSLPAAVFVWSIENTGDDNAYVSIAFTFQSGQGEKPSKEDRVSTQPFENDSLTGMQIKQYFNDMQCTYAVAAGKQVNFNFIFNAWFSFFPPIFII